MYRVTNKGEVTELLLYDDIGEGWFGGVSAKQVLADIKAAKGKTINARINSPGGDVFEGFAIYNALKNATQRIEVDIDALAASAASVVAMAGDEIRIADNAMLMIHNAWTIAAGDSAEFERTAKILADVNVNIAATYQKKSGMEADEILALMDAETWMTAEEAHDYGFVDSITGGLKVAAAVFDVTRYRHTPQNLGVERPVNEADVRRRSAAERELKLLGVL